MFGNAQIRKIMKDGEFETVVNEVEISSCYKFIGEVKGAKLQRHCVLIT